MEEVDGGGKGKRQQFWYNREVIEGEEKGISRGKWRRKEGEARDRITHHFGYKLEEE